MQLDSRIPTVELLWKGSSQAGLSPLMDTHLKQSIADATKVKKKLDYKKNVSSQNIFILQDS